MFAIFSISFSVLISFLVSRRLYVIWKRTDFSVYWEFSMFFICVGVSFSLYLLPFFYHFAFPITPETLQVWAGVMGELGNFIVLASFAFVLRAFAVFQGLRISLNKISFIAFTLSLIFPVIGFLDMPNPVLQGSLIYWHYSFASSLAVSILIALYCFSMAITFFSNLANAQKNKRFLFYFGVAFLLGGISSIAIVTFNSFALLFTGYLLLLTAFFFLGLFALGSALHKK